MSTSLIGVIDSAGITNLWGGFPKSAVDPSAHEAVLCWFAIFSDHVQSLRLPDLSDSTIEVFRDNRCWPSDSSIESYFQNWSWNRNDAARLAAVMEVERRVLYQVWEQQAIPEPLPNYDQLWRRDRRLNNAVVEVIQKLNSTDRLILKNLLRKQPCKRTDLAQSMYEVKTECEVKTAPPGNFGKSLTKVTKLRLVSPDKKGRSSTGYSLTEFGCKVAEALNGMEPPQSTRPPIKSN